MKNESDQCKISVDFHSYINHSCVPNARKHFDGKRRMTVVAARDIASGEEVLLTYTASLLAPPVRQVSHVFELRLQKVLLFVIKRIFIND